MHLFPFDNSLVLARSATLEEEKLVTATSATYSSCYRCAPCPSRSSQLAPADVARSKMSPSSDSDSSEEEHSERAAKRIKQLTNQAEATRLIQLQKAGQLSLPSSSAETEVPRASQRARAPSFDQDINNVDMGGGEDEQDGVWTRARRKREAVVPAPELRVGGESEDAESDGEDEDELRFEELSLGDDEDAVMTMLLEDLEAKMKDEAENRLLQALALSGR